MYIYIYIYICMYAYLEYLPELDVYDLRRPREARLAQQRPAQPDLVEVFGFRLEG